MLRFYRRANVIALAALALLAGCATTAPHGDESLVAWCAPPTQPAPPPSSPDAPSSKWRQPYAYTTPDAKQPANRIYFATVQRRVKSNWAYPRSAGQQGIEGTTTIDFYIAKDGHLEDAKLTSSSGTAILDDAALVAVKLAQPFPPVPDTLCKDSVGITGTFRYKVK